MKKGIIEYDENGWPKCHICGEAFKRVTTHARQVHGISAKEYKKMFGLDSRKGICSKESSQLSREKVFDNYDKVIGENLIKKGAETRYEEGSEGRTKDKMSEQTKLYLANRTFTDKQKEAMSKNGKKAGRQNIINYNKTRNRDK